MFKLAKYYVLMNLYRRAKFSIWIVLGSVIVMIMSSLVFTDLIAMAEGSSKMVLVGVKWIVLFSLLGLIGYHLRRIAGSISLPFQDGKKADIAADAKRERVLAKEKLLSRSDRIMEKYRREDV